MSIGALHLPNVISCRVEWRSAVVEAGNRNLHGDDFSGIADLVGPGEQQLVCGTDQLRVDAQQVAAADGFDGSELAARRYGTQIDGVSAAIVLLDPAYGSRMLIDDCDANVAGAATPRDLDRFLEGPACIRG